MSQLHHPANPHLRYTNRDEFAIVKNHSYNWLAANIADVKIQINKSGFDRIYIPVPEDMQDWIRAIRVNYWPSKNDINQTGENRLHSHPWYFDSLIMKGGYKQYIFSAEETASAQRTHTHTVLGNNNGEFIESSLPSKRLTVADVITATKGDILYYSNQIIHDVIDFVPNTCTLNIVLSHQGDICPTFGVYIPINAASDVELEIPVRSQFESQEILLDILHHLEIN